MQAEDAPGTLLAEMPEGYQLQTYDDCGVPGRMPHVPKDVPRYRFTSVDGDAKAQTISNGTPNFKMVYEALDARVPYVAAVTYAGQKGVLLAIEPINRYESFLVNCTAQGLRLVQEVNSSVVRLHLDTFHMNIEDRDPAEAIREAGSLLVNMHVSDSQRGPVGHGHTDFAAIMKALKEIRYQGALAMEPLPPEPNALLAVRMEGYEPLRDTYAEECMARLRAYEKAAG